jgi:hypothetical protein
MKPSPPAEHPRFLDSKIRCRYAPTLDVATIVPPGQPSRRAVAHDVGLTVGSILATRFGFGPSRAALRDSEPLAAKVQGLRRVAFDPGARGKAGIGDQSGST